MAYSSQITYSFGVPQAISSEDFERSYRIASDLQLEGDVPLSLGHAMKRSPAEIEVAIDGDVSGILDERTTLYYPGAYTFVPEGYGAYSLQVNGIISPHSAPFYAGTSSDDPDGILSNTGWVDYNNDGRLDFIYLTVIDNQTFVMLNQGAEVYYPYQAYAEDRSDFYATEDVYAMADLFANDGAEPDGVFTQGDLEKLASHLDIFKTDLKMEDVESYVEMYVRRFTTMAFSTYHKSVESRMPKKWGREVSADYAYLHVSIGEDSEMQFVTRSKNKTYYYSSLPVWEKSPLYYNMEAMVRGALDPVSDG